MIENYLLDPEAIAALLVFLDSGSGNTYDAAIVESWLGKNMSDGRYSTRDLLIDSLKADPRRFTHGKRLLNELITEFTSSRHTYINTRDVPFLTREILRRDRGLLGGLADDLGVLLAEARLVEA
jgi:hypothetical protein